MSAVYDAGRAMPEEWVTDWREALSPHLGKTEGPVLDVGAGTGIWATFIAEWFDCRVLGLEPSAGMRQKALDIRKHDGVSYVGGRAEHLPLRDDSCGGAWMSTVVHHIEDLEAAAHEARRVLHDDGPLLIRQAFNGRHDEILWAKVFPSALEIAEERHPRLEDVVRKFEDGGFQLQEVRRVRETAAGDLDQYVRKIESRADSTLTLISESDFEEGLARLRQMAEEAPAEPVTATLDLLVLR